MSYCLNNYMLLTTDVMLTVTMCCLQQTTQTVMWSKATHYHHVHLFICRPTQRGTRDQNSWAVSAKLDIWTRPQQTLSSTPCPLSATRLVCCSRTLWGAQHVFYETVDIQVMSWVGEVGLPSTRPQPLTHCMGGSNQGFVRRNEVHGVGGWKWICSLEPCCVCR